MIRRQHIAVIYGVAVLFMIPAILNGFPFLFPDSGDYLVFTPRLDRSPFYGLFIFFFHLNHFIWMPIVIQAVLISSLIWILLDIHSVPRRTATFTVLAIYLTCLSSLPFFVGFIMADIFTPSMFIVMYMLAFHYEKFSRLELTVLFLLDCVATVAHISNLTMACGILPIMAILLAANPDKRADIKKRLILIIIPIVLAAAAILLFNGLIFKIWSLSPAGKTFLLGNLLSHGPALQYLKDVCPQAGYKACAYIQVLSVPNNEMIWQNVALKQSGGYVGMNDESTIIVRETIAHYPFETLRMIAGNFLGGLMEHAPAEEFHASYQTPTMPDLIRTKFGPVAMNAFLASAEMHNTIPFALLRAIDNITTPLAFFALTAAGVFAVARKSYKNFVFTVIILSAVLGDTLLCTAISGIYSRYQARVTWLLPLAAFVVLASLTGSKTPAKE